MSAHTKGPWTYHAPSGWINADHCCERGPMHVADIRGWGHLTGGGHGAHGMPRSDAVEIQNANGNLIAAAPDLLSALENLSALYDAIWIQMSEAQSDLLKAAWAQADAAIARATGQS